MATPEEREALRRKGGIVDDTDVYTDDLLDEYLSATDGDLDEAAARIWREKAAAFAELVDISEAGSSRKNSDLYKNAMEQAAYFEGVGEEGDVPEPGTYSTTRRIVRA